MSDKTFKLNLETSGWSYMAFSFIFTILLLGKIFGTLNISWLMVFSPYWGPIMLLSLLWFITLGFKFGKKVIDKKNENAIDSDSE